MNNSEQAPIEAFESIAEIPPLLGGGKTVVLRLSQLPSPQPSGPTLDISDGAGGIDIFAPFTVMATMVYPADGAARHAAIATQKVKAAARLEALQESGSHLIFPPVECLVREWLEPHGGFSSLANERHLPTLREAFTTHVLTSGISVGRLLWWLTALSQIKGEPSLGKAIYLLQKSKPIGRRTKISRRQLIRDWQQYRTTAHLWTAFSIWNVSEGEVAQSISFANPYTLPRFLALAEIFRRIGLHTFPHGEEAPVLAPHATWQPPPDLFLPDTEITLSIDNDHLAFLEAYRANQS